MGKFQKQITGLLVLLFFTFNGISVSAEDLALIHVADLKRLMSDNTVATEVFDANRNSTRKEIGVIPGAKLLPSSSDYDTSILPANKNTKLVFYCYNPKCMASHDAAKRAIKLGYANVAVLSDGIVGWKEAGEVTKRIEEN